MKCKQTKQAFLTVFLLCLLLVSAFQLLRLGVWQIKPAYGATIFSDQFELGNGYGGWTGIDASPTIATTPVHHGINSSTANAADDGPYKDLGANYTNIWTRFQWQLDHTMAGGDDMGEILLLKNFAYTNILALRVWNNSGAISWYLTYIPDSGNSNLYVGTCTANTWYEFKIEFDSVSDVHYLYIDGTLRCTLNKVTAEEIRYIKIGGEAAFFVSGNTYSDCVVVADSDVGGELTRGDGEASTWDYRISQNATSCYLINSTGHVIGNGDPAIMLDWAHMNASDDGGGSVFVYHDTYLTPNTIHGRIAGLNPDQLNNVYVDLNGSTFKRTGVADVGTEFLSLYNYGAGTVNYTLCHGIFDGDNKAGYLVRVTCFVNSTFVDLTFQHGMCGGVTHETGQYNNWTSIYVYSWAETQQGSAGFNIEDIRYSTFDNITLDGGDYAHVLLSRGGLVMGDWVPNAVYNSTCFNNFSRIWIKNFYRDGVYMNSGAYGNRIYNNTFTNCTVENNIASGYDGIKFRPACNNTMTNMIIRNCTNGLSTGTSMPGEANGNYTGNSIQVDIYNCTESGFMVTVDDVSTEVTNNFFNVTITGGHGLYASSWSTYSPIHNNIFYVNFTDTHYGIYMEQEIFTQNTIYANFSSCDAQGWSDIYLYPAWYSENFTNNIFNVYATSGNPNGLLNFVNGTQNNLVFYPYVGGGPVTVSVFIVSPTNTTYSSSTVSVELYASGGTIDTILWNCTYTNGTVAYANTAYTAPTSMTLGNGTYIFKARANNTLGTIGYSTVTFTVAFKTTTMATTELINFYSMTTGEITTFLNLLDAQNITLFIVRLNAFSEWSSGTSSGITKAKAIVTAANALGIDVAVDLHTWYTTWDNYFDDSASGHDANRAKYVDYVENVLTSFAGSNVYAFMVMNEPQAQTASTDENNFILDVIAVANGVTSKPISVRFMGGYSPSTGHYSVSIDAACDFICRNTYWDARYPTVTVYGTSEAKLLAARDYAHANSKEFWITEFGKPYSNEENQRSYVEAFVAWANQKDVDAIFCWVSQPDASGESYNIFNGYTPRPAFYELVNEIAEEPPLGDNVVVLNQPNNLESFDYFTILFNYTATFYQGSIVNSSLWANVSGTWQRLGWNTTAIVNGTIHTISYTFAVETTYIWNIQVYNSTTVHWAFANRTFTIETTPPTDDPPTYGDYSVSNIMAGEEAIFSLPWWDDVSLVYGWLGHNSSGTWVNETVVPMFTPHLTFTDTITLNSTIGVIVSFRFYANDTAGQENATAIYSLTMGYFMAWESSPSGLAAYGTGFNLYFPAISSLAFQHLPIAWQAVGGTALFTVESGIWNGTNGELSMYASSGSLYFEALHDASLSFSNVSEFRFTVNGETYSGGTVNILNGQAYTIEWASTGVVWLLPFTFILGMIGLTSSFAGPMYAIYKVKHGEYYEGMRLGVIVTALGFALTIAWLWAG